MLQNMGPCPQCCPGESGSGETGSGGGGIDIPATECMLTLCPGRLSYPSVLAVDIWNAAVDVGTGNWLPGNIFVGTFLAEWTISFPFSGWRLQFNQCPGVQCPFQGPFYVPQPCCNFLRQKYNLDPFHRPYTMLSADVILACCQGANANFIVPCAGLNNTVWALQGQISPMFSDCSCVFIPRSCFFYFSQFMVCPFSCSPFRVDIVDYYFYYRWREL